MQKSCESRVPIHDRQRESAVRIRQTASAGACVRTTVGAVTNLNSSSGRLRGRQFVDVGCKRMRRLAKPPLLVNCQPGQMP